MNKSEYVMKLKHETENLRAEARERFLGYIVGAFSLIAGLAWNDAIKAFIEYLYPTSAANTLWAKFLYALIITLLVVIVTVYITRLLKKKDTDAQK